MEAINIYPEFVAAHQALGSAYLGLGKNDEARDAFAQAVVLDNRLPNGCFNLGRAELELKHYGSAEIAGQKAAAIAALDLKVLSTLAYAQLMNRDYPGAIATAGQVHTRKDSGHAMVHFYAAATWEAQKNAENATLELHTLLKEDSRSDAASQAREVLRAIEHDPGNNSAAAAQFDAVDSNVSPKRVAQKALEDKIHRDNDKQEAQITEAEAICETCAPVLNTTSREPPSVSPSHSEAGWTLHSNVDEVAVFFVATDHGKPVRALRQAEIRARDDGKAPASIVAFRSEEELPLRWVW